MEKNIAGCLVGKETFKVPIGNTKTSLFADKLIINFTLPLVYNISETVYEKQKVECGHKTFPPL